MKLLARVPVRVASDGKHCDERCQFYWHAITASDGTAVTPTYCEFPKLLRRGTCVPLRLSRDGRAVRCAQCVRACKEAT